MRNQHLKEHDTGCVNVGPPVHPAILYLFRGHIDWGPLNEWRFLAKPAEYLGKAKIRDDGALRMGFDEDVSGLDVSVDDILPMGVIQGIEDICNDFNGCILG